MEMLGLVFLIFKPSLDFCGSISCITTAHKNWDCGVVYIYTDCWKGKVTTNQVCRFVKVWGEVWSFGTNSMQTGQTVILVWFPMHSNKNKKRKEATGLKNQPAFFVNSSKSSRVFFMGPPKKESECINESTITLTDIILSEIQKIQRSWFKRKKMTWPSRACFCSSCVSAPLLARKLDASIDREGFTWPQWVPVKECPGRICESYLNYQVVPGFMGPL